MQTSSSSVLAKYAIQAPRYTSYPTAPHFSALPPETHAQWVRALPADHAISLYLHIPYCSKLCWFCGCHTTITQKYEPVSAYLSTLLAEITLVAGLLGRKQPVAHIHFGGGSPTLLHSHDFSQVMETLNACFDILPDAEIAIEIDPRTVSEAKIACYARAGVNRVSIGVQDFNHEVQAAINRIQPFSVVYEAIRLCREYGIGNISLDLIYGLPRQTMDSFARTLEYASLLSPSRISLFGYAHVPWKKKNMRLIDQEALPDAALRHAMFDQASDYLGDKGYMRIGLDHFVRQDDAMAEAYRTHRLKRNFQGYTTDRSDTLIGFGASAISSFPQGYAQNSPAIVAYKDAIDSARLATQRGFCLSPQDQLRRAIIEQLMCYYEADIGQACARYALPESLLDEELGRLRPLAQDGLVTLSARKIRVDSSVPQAVRLVCAAFDAYFIAQDNQHAQIA